MIYVTGDTHIPYDVSKLNTKRFPDQKRMTKNDYLIILGDFGLIWENIVSKTEMYWKEWFNNKPFTTLFLDGNHENHSRLLSGITAPEVVNYMGDYTDSNGYKIEKKFGGYVGKISDSIYHIRRGEIYVIDNRKFFVMGGAYSIDISYRLNMISWWKEEEPNTKEYYYGLDNLDKHNNTVDCILGHTAPESIIHKLFNDDFKCDSVTKFFDRIITMVSFGKFYCGHLHDDIIYDKYHFMFENVELI